MNIKLAGISFFRGLTEEEIEKFIKMTQAKIKTYSKGTRVIEAFVPNSNIGVLIEGTAQIISLDRFGNESVRHSLKCGSMLGVTSAILGESVFAGSIELITDATVLWIPYSALLISGSKLGKIHGIIMKNFLETFSRKNFLMMQKINLLSQKTIREKIIVYLMQSEKNQNSAKVKVPGRVQLAKELECNRSALTREISQMLNEGLVECGKNWMRLNKEKIN